MGAYLIQTIGKGKEVPLYTYHFLVEFHGGREGFAVPTQDVAKIDVYEVASLREQEVVVVSVPHSQQVGYHTVAS